MQIRELRAEDVPAVARIEAEVFSEPWTERDFLEMVKADYAHYYVAEEAGEITNVAVAPLFRRKGTGRRLMEYLLKKAPSCGIGDCTLEVRAGNSPAISLYESLGFRTEGIRPGFYEKPREDALIMWKRQEEQG